MRIAVVQTCTGIDPVANAAALIERVAEAKAAGAEMVFTPEMSGLVDRERARAAGNLREEADDPVLAAVRAAAEEHRLWVSIGSLALRDGRMDGRLVNRGFLIDGRGAIRARYDKLHLFDVDLANGESWRESAAYAPGERAVLVETPWGRIAPTICYDLRFSDLYRVLGDADARLIAVPAAFTVPTGKAHWHVLLRARAIETGAFVVAAAQSGRHADGRTTYGHSLVVDPWGTVLLDMGEGEGIGIVDIDLRQVDAMRAQIPVARHRRVIGPPLVLP